MLSVSVIGDSIFKGVIYNEERGRYQIAKRNLQKLLEEDISINITNYSKFGLTISKAKDIYEDMVNEIEDRFIIFEVGNNDADFNWEKISDSPGAIHLPNTPIREFRLILDYLVNDTMVKGKIPILVTPPPIDAEKYFKWLVSKGLNGDNILEWLGSIKRIYQFHECYSLEVIDCARKNEVLLLNIRQALLEKINISDYYCVDGIHLNEAGHQIMASVIKKNITKLEV